MLVGHDISVRFFYFDDKVNINTVLGLAGEICPGGKGVRYGHVVAKRLMEITIHTAFHDEDQLEFGRDEVDGAHNQPHSKYPDTFKVVLHFQSEGAGGNQVSKNASPAVGPESSRMAMLEHHQVSRRCAHALPGHACRTRTSAYVTRGGHCARRSGLSLV